MRKVLGITAFLAVAVSCQTSIGTNPWDDLDEPSDSIPLPLFADIHKNILEPKCANPACHDGSFEPDFRTIEGSYNTLVYHPVTKNDELASFEHRVVPGDRNASWLYNRITTTNDTLGQMPLYAPPLSTAEINRIVQWIETGALDIRGEAPMVPNEVPRFEWYVAFSGDVNWSNWDQNRIDKTRQAWEYPFKVVAADTVRFLFHMDDDATLPHQLEGFKMYLSNSDDYSNATVHEPEYFLGNYWTISFPPNSFSAGDTSYFYLDYSDGTNQVQSPEGNAPWWYKDHCSFYIQ